MSTYLTSANDILIDLNGRRAYLEDSLLWIHDAESTENPSAAIMFSETDLGEPSIDKLANYVDLDYTGQFTLFLIQDGTIVWSTLVDSHGIERATEWIYVPLISRKAFQKMQLYIVSDNANTKIYNIEIDFQILRRRRFE